MKVVHYTESLNEGGIASFITGLAPIQSRTVDVEICTIFRNHSVPEEIDNGGIRVDSLNNPSTILSYLYFPFKVYNHIRKSKANIIHIHCAFVYYVIAILALHRKKKFFYTVHSDAKKEKYSTRIEAMVWPIKKWFFKKNWIYPITISKESEESFFNLYGFHAKTIVNGIPLKAASESTYVSQHRITPNTKIFIHAGRISDAKNQIAMCRAFNKLISKGYDAKLLIAGSIQDQAIFSEIRKLLNDRISYIGSRTDILSLFRSSDFMLLPSKWEGMPISLLEALSQGCIPICSPVGGIPSVIQDAKNGFLCKDTTETSIFETLNRVTSFSENDIHNISLNCIQSVQPFSIEKTAQEYINYYTFANSQSNIKIQHK